MRVKPKQIREYKVIIDSENSDKHRMLPKGKPFSNTLAIQSSKTTRAWHNLGDFHRKERTRTDLIEIYRK